jgi:hypothetical protein
MRLLTGFARSGQIALRLGVEDLRWAPRCDPATPTRDSRGAAIGVHVAPRVAWNLASLNPRTIFLSVLPWRRAMHAHVKVFVLSCLIAAPALALAQDAGSRSIPQAPVGHRQPRAEDVERAKEQQGDVTRNESEDRLLKLQEEINRRDRETTGSICRDC